MAEPTIWQIIHQEAEVLNDGSVQVSFQLRHPDSSTYAIAINGSPGSGHLVGAAYAAAAKLASVVGIQLPGTEIIQAPAPGKAH